mgnify:CR=1 FL=1
MIFNIIIQVFMIYRFMLIGYILLSWIPAAQDSAVGRFLTTVCEPYLGIFRRFIPPVGMIDISPIVAIFVLNIAMRGIISLGHYI